MNRRIFIFTGCSSLLPLTAFPQNSEAAPTLQVVLKYRGAGTVDASHKIYVVLWDSPDFIKEDYKGPNPFAVKPTESKSGTVTFSGVEKNPVYVSLAYDPAGNWQGNVEPPAGTSLGFYGHETGKPVPVQLHSGHTTKILATLDDSFKNPGKKSQ